MAEKVFAGIASSGSIASAILYIDLSLGIIWQTSIGPGTASDPASVWHVPESETVHMALRGANDGEHWGEAHFDYSSGSLIEIIERSDLPSAPRYLSRFKDTNRLVGSSNVHAWNSLGEERVSAVAWNTGMDTINSTGPVLGVNVRHWRWSEYLQCLIGGAEQIDRAYDWIGGVEAHWLWKINEQGDVTSEAAPPDVTGLSVYAVVEVDTVASPSGKALLFCGRRGAHLYACDQAPIATWTKISTLYTEAVIDAKVVDGWPILLTWTSIERHDPITGAADWVSSLPLSGGLNNPDACLLIVGSRAVTYCANYSVIPNIYSIYSVGKIYGDDPWQVVVPEPVLCIGKEN